ncbi:effector-associated constant component EACC1 [Mesorhizobium yinganensis]|uniref:effector-associated constant component EACC1 n=1 Tax=Mesorhizobium yinganensis TaxID=3157707 RepID=UPI0032B8585C
MIDQRGTMMEANLKFIVQADDVAASTKHAAEFADTLREIDGVIDTSRSKSQTDTMDLGTIVSVLATSGATLAIAQGVAAWLRARRHVVLTVERKSSSESLRAIVKGIDPQTAERIIEKLV